MNGVLSNMLLLRQGVESNPGPDPDPDPVPIRHRSNFSVRTYNMNTMLYRLADRLLLLKCYDIKTVKLPGCSSVGASSCG